MLWFVTYLEFCGIQDKTISTMSSDEINASIYTYAYLSWYRIATCISAALSNHNVSCKVYHLNDLSSASADRQLCARANAYLSYAHTSYFSFCPLVLHINLTYYFYIVRFQKRYTIIIPLMKNDYIKVRPASHYTIFVVRRIRSDTIWNDGSSRRIVAGAHMTNIGTLAIYLLTLHDWLFPPVRKILLFSH